MEKRFVASLRHPHIAFVEKDPENQGRGVLDDVAHTRKIRAGKGNVGIGDKVHCDVNPVDQFGVDFGPGDPDHANMATKENQGVYVRSEVALDGGPFGPTAGEFINIGHEAAEHGCTPVVRVEHEGFDGRGHEVHVRFNTLNAAGETVYSDVFSFNLKK